MANEIIVPISIDLDSLKEGLTKAKAVSQRSGEEISSAVSDGFSSSFTSLGVKLAGIFAGFHLVGKIKDIFSDAIHESISAGTEIAKLNQALANAGQYSKEASHDFEEFAKKIQSTTVLNDEFVFSLASSARVFARTNDQTRQLTLAAIELSKATGTDAASSIEALGKTLSGTAGRLGQTIPELRFFTQEQLRAGAAIDLVLSRFGGTAANEINTFAGRLAQARNRTSDFLETLGDLVTKSPVVVQFVNGMGKSFESLGNFIKDLGPDFVGGLIKSLLNFGQAFITYVISPVELASNIFNLLFISVKSGVNAIALVFLGFPSLVNEFLIGPLIKWSSVISNVVAIFDSELAGRIKASVESFGQGVIDSGNAVRTSLLSTQEQFAAEMAASAKTLTDFPLSAALSTRLTELQLFVDQAKPITEQFKNNTVAALTATQIAALEMAKNFNAALNSGLVQGTAKAVSGLAGSLIKGQASFGSFAKMMMGIAGDLAIQLGTVLLGTGFGIEALKSLGGAAAIAAGLGLIAVGGIMKALGDGGGSSPAGGASSFTGGSSGATSDVTGLPQELVGQKPGATINLTVNGNIMDRKSSGLELVEILNEAFGSSGLTVLGSV
jgi:hypothetical protein